MENRLNFNDPQKWVSDSKELVLDTTKRFEFNVEILPDNKNVILYTHSIIIKSQKEYHCEVSYLISTKGLVEPFISAKTNKEVFSQYIFKTQQENISYAEMICGKKTKFENGHKSHFTIFGRLRMSCPTSNCKLPSSFFTTILFAG